MKKLTLSMMVVLVSLLVLVIAGCGTTKVSPAGLNVQLMKGDPPAGCKELGSVTGSSGFTAVGSKNNVDKAKADMREKAAKMGANFVRFEAIGVNAVTVSGTAYKCPPSALQ